MLKRHYDLVIVACCFLFLFANLGMASTAFSVHQPYIVAFEGIGHTGGSLILSVRTLTSLVAMFFVDRYYGLLDVRKGVFAATLCTAVGFLVDSFASSMGAFMAGAVLLGLGYGLGGMVAVTYIADRWFTGGLGSRVGFASMGSGLATILMPQVIVRIIESVSLGAAFVVEACITALIGLLVLATLRNSPADLGMERIQSTSGKARAHRAMKEAPASEHAKLMVAMVCVGVFSCCGVSYISVLATSSGYDAFFAASLVSIAGIALTVSKFATGELFDHIGVPAGSAVVFAVAIAGYGLCCGAGSGIAGVLVAGAIMVGAGISLGSVGVSVWSIDLSNPAKRAREIRNFQVAYTFGGFLANTLPGIVKDLAGSYVVSYAAMTVVTALAAALILHYYRKYSAPIGE